MHIVYLPSPPLPSPLPPPPPMSYPATASGYVKFWAVNMVHYGLGENDQCKGKGSAKSAVNLSAKMEK